MLHTRQLPNQDVAKTLVAGISGIHPDKIRGYVLFVDNTDCGLHMTTNACCAHHAVDVVTEVWADQLDTLTPCSGDGH